MTGLRGYMLGMLARRIGVLLATAALLSAAGGAAQAADKGKPIDFTVRAEPASVAPGAGKTLTWDARKGRWGLTLGVGQSDVRQSTMSDVQAGAYYRISPSLRVGGAVALGDQQLTGAPKNLTPGEGQPRVRLETAFKF